MQSQNTDTKNSPRIFFPHLDGLRFLAFFFVFLFHSFYTPNPAIKENKFYHLTHLLTREGHLGVNFFFVLSGFLITYLLLIEREQKGRIAIGAFYMRRILRIWPLYFVVVFLGFVTLPWLQAHFGQNDPHESAHPLYFLLFLANLNELYYQSNTPTLTLLWSVSVEEQFYLVWPLLMALVPARRLGYLFVGVLAISISFRLLNLHDSRILNFHTISVIGDMAMGGLVAWLCFRNTKLVNYVAGWSRWTIGFGYFLGLMLILGRSVLFEIPGYLAFDRLFLSVFFAFILLEQNYAQRSFVKMGQFRLVSYWGTYTYGLYCLHYMALLFAYQLLHRLGLNDTVLGVILGDNILGLLIALGMSWISFNLYEKHFLKLKNRFSFISRD